MMTKHDPAMGRNEVAAIGEAFCRCGSRAIEHQHFGCDESAVEAVPQRIDTDGSDDQPQAVDRFATIQRNAAKRAGADEGNQRPQQVACEDVGVGGVGCCCHGTSQNGKEKFAAT